jgi:hypothetical protein
MTPVNIKSLRPRSFAYWVVTYYGGSTHERLLSESSRSCMLAFRMYGIFFQLKSLTIVQYFSMFAQ